MEDISIVAIGGSAGSVEVLAQILPNCTSETSPPFVIVVHTGESSSPTLAEHFQKNCEIRVKEAESQEPLRPGHIYFAPPGYHLLVSENGECELNVDEPVLFSRPSIDVLFESVADAFGRRALGIVLSGANTDGALGLSRMEKMGAQVVVQDPRTTTFGEMPLAAIDKTQNPHVLNTAQICSFLREKTLCH